MKRIQHNYASESINQLTDHPQVDYHVAKLHGKHMNICGDIDCKKIVNTETIKKLTSNTDPVTARNPYERPFSFINYAKIIVALNRLPQTDAFTTGDKRRNLIISFNNKISETPGEIKDLQNVILNAGEMPGILLWAIEGLKRLEANQKFSDSRTIAQRAIEYDKKSRPARYYLEERLEDSPMNIVPNALVYEDFNRHCLKNGAAELSPDEIKKSILQECFAAGWEVQNKNTRVTSLPDITQKLLKEMGFDHKYIRCFYGIAITRVQERQTTASDFFSLTELESDILKFKEGHQVYQHAVLDVKQFVGDMKIDYPKYECEDIKTAVIHLQDRGWKTPDEVEG